MPRKETCIYCGLRPGLTDDHVPPQAFFEKPCPNVQRITVPSCELCQNKYQKIDAFARNYIASLLETESTSYVRKHIANRVIRSIKHARWEFRRLLAITKLIPVTVLTSSGIVNGFLPAFDAKIPEMNSFFERVARAMLYETFRKGFFVGRVQWRSLDYILNHFPDSTGDLLRQSFRNQGERRSVLDVFECETSPRLSAGTYFIRVIFYKAKTFILRVQEIQA